jgi:hypothetical protein
MAFRVSVGGATAAGPRTTINTQAISISRKFGVTSRADGIERAVKLGLLEDSLYPARAMAAPR